MKSRLDKILCFVCYSLDNGRFIMGKLNFQCIIVLYNVNFMDSITYQDIVKTQSFKEGTIHLYLVDNSTKDYGNHCSKSLDHVTYLPMYENAGLSKAYNRALDAMSDMNNKVITLFDDDTHVTNEYFNKIEEAYYKTKAEVYLPIIYDQNKELLSPSVMKKYRCVRAKSINEINDRNICGINTGMAIRSEVFINYRYNEDIFLDFVDHNFIRDMKEEEGAKIVIVDTLLTQNFSLISDDYESTIKRFKIAKKDINTFYAHRGLLSKMVYWYSILRRKMRYFKQFKKIGVFFE